MCPQIAFCDRCIVAMTAFERSFSRVSFKVDVGQREGMSDEANNKLSSVYKAYITNLDLYGNLGLCEPP